MSGTHKTHPEAEENLHISLVDKILQIGHHRSSNDKPRILFKNLTCLWTDTDHPEVLQIKQGIPYAGWSVAKQVCQGLDCLFESWQTN
jgi:hypothetical protein